MKHHAIFITVFSVVLVGFIGLSYHSQVEAQDDFIIEEKDFLAYEFQGVNNEIDISVYEFVTRFYVECLNREPDPDGFNGWVNAINGGWISGATLAQSFMRSPEFQNLQTSDEAFVTILYRAILDREPDTFGFEGWVSALKSGIARNSVIWDFAYSEEFYDLCAQHGISATKNDLIMAFVIRFYNNCYNREPDEDELNGSVSGLSSGFDTGTSFAERFMLSQEFVDRGTTDEEFLNILYQTLFNRNPDLVGFNGWLYALYSGTSREAVLDGFVSSEEFSNLCVQLGIYYYINNKYPYGRRKI